MGVGKAARFAARGLVSPMVAALVVVMLCVGTTRAQNEIDVLQGIATTLAEAGANGPDIPHDFHPDGDIWEWDGEDGGGENHGLVWFDIPANDLNGFSGAATLQLFLSNGGAVGSMHRVTEDWVSGLGIDVTWNDMPGGPGLVVGDNVIEQSNSTFPGGPAGEYAEVDVSVDVAAWASGEPNYGWGFVPTGNDGTSAGTFMDFEDQRPILTLKPGEDPPLPPPPPLDPADAVSITSGVDTTLADGLNGPDGVHGAAGDNPEGDIWEWDGSDAGGRNDGLVWFDVPNNVLTEFAKLGDQGQAAIRLYIDNNGNAGTMYRMTEDWLSGPNGGDNVTKNNIPGGPGVVPGGNAEATSNYTFPDSIGQAGTVIQLDVSEDVQAWASGEPNYGWGIIGAGGDGAGIASFENAANAVPELLIGVDVEVGAQLEAGDADQDLDFDQFDLIKVQVAGKYLTGQAATWGDGDWNAAPGGSQGNPPAGDGFFNQLDIIAASLGGKYLTGPYAAIAPGGAQDDGQTSIIYNAGTGEVSVDAPAGVELTSVNIDSAGGIFTGEAAMNLGGSFDNDADNNIFKATFGSSFASLSFGNVAQAGLSEEFVAGDLTVVGSLAGGGDLGAVDLIYVPEPSTMLLLALGLLGVVANRRRRR